MGTIILPTPIGPVTLTAYNGYITSLDFGALSTSNENSEDINLLNLAAYQLIEYFDGTRKVFDLPLLYQGTPFLHAVWHELSKIPYGQTMSYGELAVASGYPRAARAVGLAMNKNPIAIILPCHRVVGKSGSLVGFGGGLEIKKYLLALERSHKDI